MPDQPTTLTYGLRELVWGIESEVAVIGSLGRQIDENVETLNRLRAELAERLMRLDDLRGAAHDPELAAYIEDVTQTPMPTRDEEFPERIYGP